MTNPTHTTALPSHYDAQSEHYDPFNEKSLAVINKTVEEELKQANVYRILDMTCGTGIQVFWLANAGFDVVGMDISAKMLDVARKKGADQTFIEGDMRTSISGEFDAVITIFNSVGHLTKSDFELALQNIHRNLKMGGLYIFDINNLEYLLEGNRITDLTIDWLEKKGAVISRKIQYSTIDREGILASFTTYYVQEGASEPSITTEVQTLQVYTADQLREMLERNGFAVLKQCATDGLELDHKESDRILSIAKKT